MLSVGEQSYLCEISEEQRLILVAALEAQQPTLEANEEQFLLLAMLREDLPKIEAESPGIIHGLCL